MIKDLYNWTLAWSTSLYAPWALFFISMAESSVFPLPPDLLLIAMCLASPEQSFFYALICSVGSVLGGIIGHALGKFGGRPLALKIFSEEKIQTAESLYRRYDKFAIAVAGFTPIPYKVFTIAAGMLKIPLFTLVWVSALTRSARFFLVATLIYFYGAPIKAFIDTYFNLLTIGFTVCLIGGFFILKLFKSGKAA
jgi:membrane protein YqaA with SNARE-associated domain